MHRREGSLRRSLGFLGRLRLVAGRGWGEVGDGGAPSALVRRFLVVAHQPVFGQNLADVAPQRPGAFPVDDADARESLLVTGTEIFGDQVAHVRWIEDVEIKDAVDWVFFHRL